MGANTYQIKITLFHVCRLVGRWTPDKTFQAAWLGPSLLPMLPTWAVEPLWGHVSKQSHLLWAGVQVPLPPPLGHGCRGPGRVRLSSVLHAQDARLPPAPLPEGRAHFSQTGLPNTGWETGERGRCVLGGSREQRLERKGGSRLGGGRSWAVMHLNEDLG